MFLFKIGQVMSQPAKSTYIHSLISNKKNKKKNNNLSFSDGFEAFLYLILNVEQNFSGRLHVELYSVKLGLMKKMGKISNQDFPVPDL